MAVVIRLQGLPVVAGSVDIRHFFSGLQIPDGGVHIIGGNLGEAFVIFATDEDARRAMSRVGGVIKNSHVQLFLSSKTEMQNTLEMSRKHKKNPKHPAVPPSGDMGRPSTMKGANHNKFEKKNYDSDLNSSGSKHSETHVQKYEKKEEQSPNDDLYLYLYGLPYNATEEDVRHFFKGLEVVDVVFLLRPNGLKNGNGCVKFGSVKDAKAAMNLNNEYIGHRFISLSKITEEKWILAGGAVENAYPKQSRKRTRSRSPQNQQFYVHLKNLSNGVQKEDIKHFFGAPDMADSEIKFLFDKHSNRAKEGFVMLKSQRQYEKCLGLHKSSMKGRPVFIFPIPRKAMLELIESYETQTLPKQERTYEDFPRREQSNLKRCLYLRNFPFDVSKAEVQNFFSGFRIHEDDIHLLFDNKGVGLGEALVRFPSEEQAMHAERLNRQRFLGTEVLLRRIPDEQTKEFGAFIDTPPVDSRMRHSPGYRDEYIEHRQPESHDRSYEFPQYDRREFRGSPERQQHGSYPMEFGGRDEPYDRFDTGNYQMEYDNSLQDAPQKVGGSVGAIIRMRNLPYTTTLEEILDFFYGYNIIPSSIDIKFNRKGMATGHATVCSDSYDEAMAAVNDLNERPIGARKIILTLTRI